MHNNLSEDIMKNGFTRKNSLAPLGRGLGRGVKAFTLAEVLITLGVIGVVAAMTLPSVIKHYQQQATVNQLKKAYSEFSQALHKAEVDNGLMETWNFADFATPLERATYFGENYLFPYIKTVEKCVPSSNKCWADKITNVSGNILGESDGLSNAKQYVSFVTASGYSGYYWLNGNGFGMWYWVDINGPQKGPNKIGRDIFTFGTWWGSSANIGKISSGAIANNLTRDEMITQGCSRKNAKYYNDGQFCGALIMHDGWKIGDGYPW